MAKESASEGDDRLGVTINPGDSKEPLKGFYSYNPVGNFTFVDDYYASFFGYTKEEMMNMNFIELVHTDDIENILKLYEFFVRTGSVPSSMIVKCLRKNKTTVIIEMTSEVIRVADEIKGTKGFAIILNPEVSHHEPFSETNIQELKNKVNELDTGMKRTFTTIRNIILICLSSGQLSINEVAHLSGINWKTVENHLTYLIGKKLVRENFSSKYVRIFELTRLGQENVSDLRKKMGIYFRQKVVHEQEVTRL